MTRFLTQRVWLSWFAATLLGALLLFQAPATASFTPDGNCNGYNPDDPYGLDCGDYSGLSDSDPRLIAARIINITLSLLGIIVTVVIVYAGFKWMTAGGNEEEAKSARRILAAAVIGLIIILTAYSVSSWVLSKLAQATNVGQSYYVQ